MRITPRAILLAAMAAVLVLMTLQPASAQDIQATPIVEPESTETPESISSSSLNQPMANGDIDISFTTATEAYNLPYSTFEFTINWDVEGVDFLQEYGVPYENVHLKMELLISDGYSGRADSAKPSEDGNTGSVTFSEGPTINAYFALSCVENNGRVVGFMKLTAYEEIHYDPFYTHDFHEFDIPCSVDWAPDLPFVSATICGTGNDEITLPDPFYGLAVTDSGWQGDTRTITFPTESWINYPAEQ